MASQRLTLLCLDGGGVRGLSSLYVLQQLMAEVGPDPENPPKPCEYFDMIGGTSTGGLIAIMLGRLQMSVDECIKEYKNLALEVFQKKHFSPIKIPGELKARYSSKALQVAVQGVLELRGLAKDVLLKDDGPVPCKVRVGPELYNSAKLWEAARATSAASTSFEPIKIGSQEFVDGGLGANNPIRQMWNEAKDVSCEGSNGELANNTGI